MISRFLDDIQNIENIRTPRLLVFRNCLENNLSSIKNHLEETVTDTAYKHLCPHVKTNKSSFIIKLMMNAGITDFKCTLNEVEMLVSAGVKDIFISYPLLKQDAIFIAKLIQNYSTIDFQIQIGSIEHFNIIKKVADEQNVKWNYFIDIDVGMHRTGI